MYWELIGLLLLLLASGFFSSSELAYVLANKIKVEIRARKNHLASKNILYFINHPQIFFSTILISNNIINIAFASLVTIFLSKVYGMNDAEILLVSTLLLLFIGELIPKYIAREIPDTLANIVAIPVRAVSIILYPVIKITAKISSVLTVSTQQTDTSFAVSVDKDDIQSLLAESSLAGSVELKESDVISKVIELGEQKVYEAMTPRTDIVGVEINSPIGEVLNTFITSGYSKLPVFEENIDNIKGMIIAHDMFKNPEDVKSVMRETIFVPETKKTLETLNELLEKSLSTAIVVDEFGGTEGIVTIEDILEEIVGEIRDEFDVEDDICKKTSNDTYIISGKVEVDFINEEFDLHFPDGDYETLAGYITHSTGNIPEKGDSYKIDHFKILILRADKKKIDLVKVVVDTAKLAELQAEQN
ncbi:MAG: HlyC/CorC family transporter [Ignavibacteriae bacterium]|nr:HlyC/CorC family transporter [Ignavibacteriota bacterium]NOG98750.1 HlyC/CorC family transporter [Ignavibacteriota bacterium]